MRTDMVLLDLDGTLLNEKQQVSNRDKEVLRDISDSGIYVVYVTARTGRRISELIDGMPCDALALLNGGDIRMTFADGTRLQLYDGMPGSTAVEILDGLIMEESGDIAGFFDQYELWNGRISENGRDIGAYNDCRTLLSQHKCQRIRVYNSRLHEIMPDNQEVVAYYENGDTIIESRFVNKKTAVYALGKEFGISHENVIAFGDSEADIPMFEAVGISIAMANAADNVKAIASEVTSSNTESGVAEYLSKRLGLKNHIHSGSMTDGRCIFLLKDVKGLVPVLSAEEKRKRVSIGLDAQDFLAQDPAVPPETLKLFREKARDNSVRIAECVGRLAEKIYRDSDAEPVLVSLVRGGIMTGALCKHYIEKYYGKKIPHYALSLIRGVGIDENALSDIIKRHGDKRIRFIDGWTGSGLISKELDSFVTEYNLKNNTEIDSRLAVLSDTSCVCQICGTREDIFLPECCLNGTICGLLSSVCLCGSTSDDDYHGAIILDDLESEDQTGWYYELICGNMRKIEINSVYSEVEFYGRQLQERICEELELDCAKRVRLGLGESTRAIFRTRLKELLVKDLDNEDNAYILHLSTEKGISIRQYDTGKYNCIAILEK